ncbi:MAG: ABC transporter substrate-binding protein [Coriobacteriales bacterium]|nr:ABC transporter substrate-binding protein [Coriobacteriales bacterium]
MKNYKWLESVLRRRMRSGMLLLLASAVILMSGMLFACTANPGSTGSAADPGSAAESLTVRVSSLKGPTSIGLAQFIADAKTTDDTAPFLYEFAITGTPDEILTGLIRGDIDIALLPVNLASVLFNKTDGGIEVLNINTLGVLHVVSGDTSIRTFDDLAGRTVIMAGKGSIPEYVMNHLLAQAGLADSVTLDFRAEATEVAAVLAADPSAVGVLPEPYATSVVTKVAELDYRLDLTAVWEAMSATGQDKFITGVTVARSEFIEAHPEALQDFIDKQASSIEQAQTSPQQVAPLVVEAGIVDNVDIAQKALPRCNLVNLSGDTMKQSMQAFLAILFGYNPAILGGELPSDAFYYCGSTN